MKLVLIGDLHFPAIDQGVSGIAEARQSFFFNIFFGQIPRTGRRLPHFIR